MFLSLKCSLFYMIQLKRGPEYVDFSVHSDGYGLKVATNELCG